MCFLMFRSLFFFFKQKTAYELRISDWSSDVCSSDLDRSPGRTWLRAGLQDAGVEPPGRTATCVIADAASAVFFIHPPGFFPHAGETPAFSLEVSIMSNIRSEERRGGKECVSKFKSRWSLYH